MLKLLRPRLEANERPGNDRDHVSCSSSGIVTCSELVHLLVHILTFGKFGRIPQR